MSKTRPKNELLWDAIQKIAGKQEWREKIEANPQAAWREFAEKHAEHNNTKDFSTRRGYYVINDFPVPSDQVICLFNNRPYKKLGYGNSIDHSRRDKETELFRQRLVKAGISELGYGTYPPPGDKLAGYSYAMLLDANESQIEIILNAFYDAVREADQWYENSSEGEVEEHERLNPEQGDILQAEVGVKDEIVDTASAIVKVGVASQLRQVRVGQDAFSRAVRHNYGHRCCFPGCEVDHDDLLVAAHIARWADDSEFRGDIANGLCLCGLHDKAFESGFFTLTDDLLVRVDIRKADLSVWVESQLRKADGQGIKLGKIRPLASAISKHRERHS